MATIYNSNLSKEIQEGAKLQVRDRMPNELADKVIPTMEVNPKAFRAITWSKDFTRATSAAGVTVASTEAEKRTFLKGVSIQVQSGVTADNTTITFSGKVVGQSSGGTVLIRLDKLTTTACTLSKEVFYDCQGLELQPGTTMTLSNTFTAGNSITSITLWGYTIDNPRA